MIEDHHPYRFRVRGCFAERGCLSPGVRHEGAAFGPARRKMYNHLDFSFGFRFDPALCCICEGSRSALAEKPPGCASVKGTPRCDIMALENLNRLDYVSRVPASGVKADRP
jgi:hypothetical protein